MGQGWASAYPGLAFPYPSKDALPPWAADHSAGACRNFSTSASIAAGKRFDTLASASTSHHVASTSVEDGRMP